MAIADILHLIDIRIAELQQARSILATFVPSNVSSNVPSRTVRLRRKAKRVEHSDLHFALGHVRGVRDGSRAPLTRLAREELDAVRQLSRHNDQGFFRFRHACSRLVGRALALNVVDVTSQLHAL